MTRLFSTLTLVALISFGLHVLWESLHVRLYTGYEYWTLGLPVVLLATVGDVLYTLGAFALISAIKRSVDWVHDAQLADYFSFVALGFLIALFVEYKGLALEKWQYLPEMPIIPVLQVGLTPVLQMALLLPVTFFLASRLISRG